MLLHLVPLPADPWAHRGIYPQPEGDQLPERMRWLHPDAARDVMAFENQWPDVLVFTDVFRSPQSSLDRWRKDQVLRAAGKRTAGAQRPGWSLHNFGLAVGDLAIERTLARWRGSYRDLLAALAPHGIYCHRRDGEHEGPKAKESWHLNHLGHHAADHLARCTRDARTWARAGESRIQEVYGAALAPGDAECQLALAQLGYNPGPADGDLGPKTLRAVARLRADWSLAGRGLDARARRLLAVLTARVA